jgi:hypothetical protein
VKIKKQGSEDYNLGISRSQGYFGNERAKTICHFVLSGEKSMPRMLLDV